MRGTWPHLLEILFLQVADGLVDLEAVRQLHVLWAFHLINAPGEHTLDECQHYVMLSFVRCWTSQHDVGQVPFQTYTNFIFKA